MKIFIIFTSLFFIIAAYFLNFDVPKDCENPWKTKFIHLKLFFIDYLSSASEFLGIHDKISTTRFFNEKLFQPSLNNSSKLNIFVKHFNGVRVLLFSPVNRAPDGPIILYLHGGEWTYFSPEYYGLFLSELALQLNVVVGGVGYRRAPEHLHPAALDDCRKAVEHLLSLRTGVAVSLGVNPGRVALAGDGTGAGMAAAIAHQQFNVSQWKEARDRIKLLILFRPVLQVFSMGGPSSRAASSEYSSSSALAAGLLRYTLGRDAPRQFLQEVLTDSHVSSSQRATLLRQFSGTPLAGALELATQSGDDLPQLGALGSDERLSPLLTLGKSLDQKSRGFLPPMFMTVCDNDAARDDALTYSMLVERLRMHAFQKTYSGCTTSIPSTTIRDLKDFLQRNVLL